MTRPAFRFRQFLVGQEGAAHPVGTDGVLLGAWANSHQADRILDVGTGTGIVALMLAQRFPQAQIDAVELHSASAACAESNFKRSLWAERLHCHQGSIQEFAVKSSVRYDFIASNPPFFTETVISPDAVRRLGRNTTTLTFSELTESVCKLLKPDGCFFVVLPPREASRLIETSALYGLYLTEICAVRARPQQAVERTLLKFEKNPYFFKRSEISIYEKGEEHSDAFIKLTQGFYLHL